MRIFNNANTIVSDIIVLDKELSEKEIDIYSRYDIRPKRIILDSQPLSPVKRDCNGMIKNEIDYGYDVKGALREQSEIKANCIYIGKTADNLFKLFISTQDKVWTKGTDIPDSSFKLFSYRYLREG